MPIASILLRSLQMSPEFSEIEEQAKKLSPEEEGARAPLSRNRLFIGVRRCEP
jgi:hypothetical protein